MIGSLHISIFELSVLLAVALVAGFVRGFTGGMGSNAIIALVLALMVWQWPIGVELAWLLAVGALGRLGQLSFVRAYALVDVSFAKPMVFTRLM